MDRAAFEQFVRLDRDHWWFRGRRAVYLGLVGRALGGRPVARALDLGCGPGGFLPGLARLSERVVAVDRDRESLLAVRERAAQGSRIEAVACDAGSLPFRAQSFDLVALFDVLEHVDDDVGALREVHRVLSPGGLAALSVPAYPWLYANNDRVAQHRRRYTRRGVAEALEQAGFEVVRNTHANVVLAPLIVPFALLVRAAESSGLAGAGPQRTNLSWPLPAWLHGVFARLFACELAWTARWNAPFGHSIAVLARRR